MYARLYADYENMHRYLRYAIAKVNVDAELSIPAFYATILLLLSSALLWWASRVNYTTRLHRTRWTMLSAIFLVLALDEATSFHEFLNANTLRSYVPDSKYLYWTWVIPGTVFALTVFLIYVPFLLALPRNTAGLMLVAGALYVGGAVGVEVIGAAFYSDEGGESLSYNLTAHVEEFFEMSGLITFIYCLLHYLRAYPGQLVIAVDRPTDAAVLSDSPVA